jgi:hypothetical protein
MIQEMCRLGVGDDLEVLDGASAEDDGETVILVGVRVVGLGDAGRAIILNTEKHEGRVRR